VDGAFAIVNVLLSLLAAYELLPANEALAVAVPTAVLLL
jgi:hypothetical protein